MDYKFTDVFDVVWTEGVPEEKRSLYVEFIDSSKRVVL